MIQAREVTSRPKASDLLDMGERSEEAAPQFYNPVDLPPSQHRFSPIAAMLMGRRNVGKSLAMTLFAHAMMERYQRWAPHFKLMTNYTTSFAIVNPFLVDDTMGLPKWARNLYVAIDEISLACRSRRSMSTRALNFTNFLTIIRKRRIEPIFATQFPAQIDKDLIIQVDLFLDVEQLGSPYHLLFKVYDWWGQWSGNRRWKRFPPLDSDVDGTFEVIHDGSIFHMFDTDQVPDSVYLDDETRMRLVQQEFAEADLERWAREISPVVEEAERAVDQDPSVLVRPPAQEDTQEEWHENLPDEFQLHAVIAGAKKAGVIPDEAKVRDLADYLKDTGLFDVDRVGRTGTNYCGRRKAA